MKAPPPPPKKRGAKPPPPPPPRRSLGASVLASPVGESVLEQGKRRMGLKAPLPPPPRTKPTPLAPRTKKPLLPPPAKTPPRTKKPLPPPPAKVEPVVTDLSGLLAEPWPACICVWCMRLITDAAGNLQPGSGGWPKPKAIPAYWRSPVTGSLYQGFACKTGCRAHWELGWGTAYRGTSEGERCESVWRSRGRRVKETKDRAYPQFGEEYRKSSYRRNC